MSILLLVTDCFFLISKRLLISSLFCIGRKTFTTNVVANAVTIRYAESYLFLFNLNGQTIEFRDLIVNDLYLRCVFQRHTRGAQTFTQSRCVCCHTNEFVDLMVYDIRYVGVFPMTKTFLIK